MPHNRRPPEREFLGEGLSFGETAKKWMRRQEREGGEKKETTKTMTKEEQGDAEDKAEEREMKLRLNTRKIANCVTVGSEEAGYGHQLKGDIDSTPSSGSLHKLTSLSRLPQLVNNSVSASTSSFTK